MVDQSIIDRYIEESTVNMMSLSKRKAKNVITSFLLLKPEVKFSDLTRDDLIEMFSMLALISQNSFHNRKSEIKDFAKWMNENGYATDEIIYNISSIQYSDIDRTPYFDKYYFKDLTDLYDAMEEVFSERGSEFDTFRVSAILVWCGLEVKEICEILKSDFNEDKMEIICSQSGKKVRFLDEIEHIGRFIIDYKDSDSYDSRKLGGRTLKYMNSKYLLRSYKSAHYTVPLLSNLAITANRVAKEREDGKLFQLNRISLSGLYYRIYQYENENGVIDKIDLKTLQSFFNVAGTLTSQKKLELTRKYNEYREFRDYFYL